MPVAKNIPGPALAAVIFMLASCQNTPVIAENFGSRTAVPIGLHTAVVRSASAAAVVHTPALSFVTLGLAPHAPPQVNLDSAIVAEKKGKLPDAGSRPAGHVASPADSLLRAANTAAPPNATAAPVHHVQ